MSKRKRSTSKDTPPAEPAETPESDPTVHVTSDMLAGSPDIFAPGKERPVEGVEDTPTSSGEASEEEMAAPEPPAGDAPSAFEDDTPAASAEAPPAHDEPAAIVSAPPPPAYQPRPPAAGMPAPGQRRAGSSVALGVVLVVLGLFALLVGFISFGTGALIPGAILTVIGLILAYMNASQDWPAWAFAWPLVAPGGVGLGIWLQGLRHNDAHLLRQGRVLMFVALLIFMIGFVIFTNVFHISDQDYGWFGKAALPALLIAVGIVLLARSIQRGRTT